MTIDNPVFLPASFAPSERDVICAWARQNHRHGGNQRFRKIIEQSAPLYVAARTKQEKTQVIAAVVNRVRRESPGGGFVKRDFHSGLWFEIGDDKARDKVGHAIRKAVEEMSKKGQKSGGRSKSKQAINASSKGGEAAEAVPTPATTVKSALDAHAQVKPLRATPAAAIQAGQMDALVMPPLAAYHHQPAALSALDSAQMPQMQAATRAVQQGMVVPPAAGLFQQAGAHAFDLFGAQPVHVANESFFAQHPSLMTKQDPSGLRYLF